MANDMTGYKRLVTLGDTIAGEDLTNGWTEVAVSNSPFKKVALAELFASTTITASAANVSNWISVDGYTRYCLFLDINDGGGAGTCTVTVHMAIRPAAATALQYNVQVITGITNKVVITNVQGAAAENYGAFGDEISFNITETAGADGTISNAYLLCAA